MTNFVTEKELNNVKGLLHYLNQTLGERVLDFDIRISDSNGEPVGRIAWNGDDVTGTGYVFWLGAE